MSPPREDGHLHEPGTIGTTGKTANPEEMTLHEEMILLGTPREGVTERSLTP